MSDLYAVNSFPAPGAFNPLNGTHVWGGIESGPWIAYYRQAGVSGSWTAGELLGHINADGIKLSTTPLAEDIQCNAYGETVIDQLFMGVDASISFTLQQVGRAAVRNMLYDWSYFPLNSSDTSPYTQIGGYRGAIGQVGRPATSYAGKLRIFPLHYQNPVWANNNATGWHYEFVTMMNGEAIEEALVAGLHTIPITLRVLPFVYDDATLTGNEPVLMYRRAIADLSAA